MAAAIGFALLIVNAGVSERAWDYYILDGTLALVCPVMGALIIRWQPRNAVGWILVAPVMLGIAFLAEQYAAYTLVTAPGALSGGVWAAWIAMWAWAPGFLGLLTLLILLFPDGHPPTARWRPIAWLAAAMILAETVMWATRPGPIENFPSVTNPLGVGSIRITEDVGVGLPLVTVAALCMIALFTRFRRSHDQERAQLKWFLYSALLALCMPALADAVAPPILSDVAQILTLLLIPVAIAVAVLRYSLYDIDRLISRTLSYVLLTGSLVLVYVALVGLLQGLVTVDDASSWQVAVSTLVVAALFQPARRRFQATVDRRFDRARYDRQRILHAVRHHARNDIDLDSVSAVLLDAVNSTLRPVAANLWLRDSKSARRRTGQTQADHAVPLQ